MINDFHLSVYSDNFKTISKGVKMLAENTKNLSPSKSVFKRLTKTGAVLKNYLRIIFVTLYFPL